MAKINKENSENVSQFKDFTNRSWLAETDGKNIKVGDSASKIMSGECENLEVSEILHGDTANTWLIAISTDGTHFLLKSSRELK